ncbi:MAG: hypothetical protein IPK82_35160 [Polyangiaceae bacterium]|nr:hypothetical protein [Polyangiaceae bacterium]
MARTELTDRTSWDDSYDRVAYTADALSLAGEDGDKVVGALGKPIEKLLAQWEALDGERRSKRRGIGRAHALVRRRDVQADAVVQDIHNDVLGHVKQRRDDPLFARLFPDPLSVVVRMALESQLPVMRALAHKLGEEETPAAIQKAHAKPLADATERGDAAVKGREEAFAQAGRTSARVASWRDDANHALRGVEGALQKIASERRLGLEWVDSFFPVADRRPRAVKKDGGGSGGSGGAPA